MLDAVFISDLHLNPQEPQLTSKFNAFIDWALDNTHHVYVLGDLFHVWAGDDLATSWDEDIGKQFQRLVERGIKVYFMPGNRDFLLARVFAKHAGFKLLPDPTVITLDGRNILLAHGDAYCLLDKAHQRFRKFTRNECFIRLFLLLPASWRARLVGKVRARSQRNRNKSPQIWDVVPAALIKDMRKHHVNTLIHGHIHKPGIQKYEQNGVIYSQFVLSDWDDIPQILGYNKTYGLEFVQISL